ncbi:MAG: SCO family protein [Chloroflexota bacterium]
MLPTNHPPTIARWQRGRFAASLLLIAMLALLTAGCVLPAPLVQPAPAPLNGALLTPPRPIPGISLLRTDGRAFVTTEMQGRLSLVFFGYTFCPDVCPMTLLEVAQVRRLLGRDANRLDAYFITVDPARDTPERLRAYAKGFDPAIEPLTGTSAELEQMREAFGAIAARREAPDGGPGYSMDHTAALFLVDTSGSISLAYAYGTPPEQIADDIGQLLRR